MSLHQKEIVGFAFVNNTYLCISRENQDAAVIAHQMQQSPTNGKGLSQAMDGKLVPDKFFWYLIDQKWSQGQWYYQVAQQALTQLVVADTNGRKVYIPCLELAEAWWTLGV